MNGFKLKDDFLMGVATAATQIEGGDVNSNWNDWYKKGHIKDGSDPAQANDHYKRFREDIELMASMGIEIYRFGIEWARIEPDEGIFDENVLSHYREEILLMRKNGILPLLTIHHFNNPMWFENSGGFERDDASEIFLRYTLKVLGAMGDIVSEYITINEPNVYAVMSYFYGLWPPGRKSFSSVRRIYKNFTICHIESYKLIHKTRREMGFADTKVSFANHIRVFEPGCRFNPWHILCAKLMNTLFQGGITKSMSLGRKAFPVGKIKGLSKGRYYDFIGINYYTRSTVKGFKDGVRAGAPVNDLGWEIYPEGIIRSCEMLYKKYKAPIYITENGTCDNLDIFRSKYIYEHLKAISESDLPIRRYYHWSFTDNFEWIEGESSRFGIVHVDYETQSRTIKQSGVFYSSIINNKGISEDLFNKYVSMQKYKSL